MATNQLQKAARSRAARLLGLSTSLCGAPLPVVRRIYGRHCGRSEHAVLLSLCAWRLPCLPIGPCALVLRIRGSSRVMSALSMSACWGDSRLASVRCCLGLAHSRRSCVSGAWGCKSAWCRVCLTMPRLSHARRAPPRFCAMSVQRTTTQGWFTIEGDLAAWTATLPNLVK